MKGKKMTVSERVGRIELDVVERRKVFKELCVHLSHGKSLDCFELMSPNSVRKYIKAYPEEFSQEELDSALRKGREFWEDIGVKQADGHCLGNSRTWFYNMANRYGWREKIDIEAEHKGQVNVNVVSYASSKQRKDECEQ